MMANSKNLSRSNKKASRPSASSPASSPARNVKFSRSSAQLVKVYLELKEIFDTHSKIHTRMMLCFAAAFVSLLCLCYAVVNDTLIFPYMDEPFHVEQAQAYCGGHFSYWNQKITTPPGLYLFSIGILRPFHHLWPGSTWFDSGDSVCPLEYLRLTNFFFACGNFYLIYHLMKRLHSKSETLYDVRIGLSSFSLALFPPFFFFNFLYYTDAGSVFFVLITILFDLYKRTWFASIFGLISLVFRQNNIVWIFMLAAHHSLRIISSNYEQFHQKRGSIYVIFTSALQIFYQCAGYLICAILFLLFVYFNRGIVLGDRQAHVVVPHFAQFCYFLGFVAVFSWSYVFTLENFRSLARLKLKYFAGLLFVGLLMLIAIHRFSYVHPYLLADNRHFAFYVWRRILSVHWLLKSSYVLVYLFTFFVLAKTTAHRGLSFQFVFLLSCVAILAPAHLFELRYFILAYLVWRINLFPASGASVVCEIFFNTSINLITFYLFLFRPFEWKHLSGEQHFMW